MAIERKFVQQNLKELQIKQHVFKSLGKVGVAELKLQRTPLGEKILIRCSRPGLVVGRGGQNIQRLTRELKEEFTLENPQIEIEEVQQPMLEPDILAEMISNSLERFGPGRFKGIGHKALNEAMRSGALGVEILVSGKVPSQRSRTWRFYSGYMKKCGDVAQEGVNTSYRIAKMKMGVVGIKVSVIPPDTVLPDRIDIHPVKVEEVTGKDEVKDVEEAVKEADKEPKDSKKEDGKSGKGSKKEPKSGKKAAKKSKKKSDKKKSGKKDKDDKKSGKEEKKPDKKDAGDKKSEKRKESGSSTSKKSSSTGSKDDKKDSEETGDTAKGPEEKKTSKSSKSKTSEKDSDKAESTGKSSEKDSEKSEDTAKGGSKKKSGSKKSSKSKSSSKSSKKSSSKKPSEGDDA